jgi:hypothetical protein
MERYMINTSKRSRRQKHPVRLDVAAKLIAAYVKLSKDEKEIAEGFLALQIYGEGGMYPYRPLPGGPLGFRSTVFHRRLPTIVRGETLVRLGAGDP